MTPGASRALGRRLGIDYPTYIERRIAVRVYSRTPSVNRVEVRLFNLNGTTLGAP